MPLYLSTPTGRPEAPDPPGPARTRRHLGRILAAGTGVATMATVAAVGADAAPGASRVARTHPHRSLRPHGSLRQAGQVLEETAQVPAQAAQVPQDSAQVPAQASQVPAQAGQVHIESVSTPVVLSSAETTSSPQPAGPGSDLGTFMVTCYAIQGRTASGEETSPQSVAVDPAVIPLGTRIWIQGVGYRTADDTGGSVRGHHVDIWESSTAACDEFGRQYRDVRRAS